MKVVWTLARRELRALFDHPTGYILLIVFLAVNNFLFFRQAYLVGIASLRPMLDLLPWLLLFLIPAVTMRILAEDTRTGTIEIVLAQPITEWELLLGKYVGAVLFLWIALAVTLALPIGLSLGADLHVGVIVAQYVGSALLIAGLAAVGTWASSLTPNQISAFILGVGVMFVLVLVGLSPLIVGLPPALGALAARLGVLTHFENIGRGVIDLRDVVYFASLAAVFLLLAYAALMGRRFAAGSAAHNRLRLGAATLVAVAVVVNLLGRYIGGRIDLTPGNAYTLSSATRDIVRNLDDLVTLKLFVSKDLPPQIALLKRDIDDLFADLRSAGDGNVRIVERDPAKDEEAEEEARNLGIPPIRFNVIGEGELQIKEGYMGLAIQYAAETETIPLIRQSDDLEYRLASAIRSMSQVDQTAVGLVTAVGNPMAPTAYQALRQQLSQAYDVSTVPFPSDSQPSDDLDVLVIAGEPDSLPAAQADRLRAFFARGGGALIMASGMTIDAQQPFASPTPVSWNDVIAPYGVSVRSDMIYDLQSNERVAMPTNFGRLYVSYPLWVRALTTGLSPVSEEIATIFVPWTSSIDTAAVDSGTVVTPLFVSSPAAGISAGPTFLDPQRQFATDSLGPRLVATMVVPPASPDTSAPHGRLVLIGNADFVSDRYVQQAPENLLFVLNAVDWLAQDEALIRIRSKDRRPPALVMSSGKRDTVKYANLIGLPVLVGLSGVARLLRRRRKTRMTYQKPGGAL